MAVPLTMNVYVELPAGERDDHTPFSSAREVGDYFQNFLRAYYANRGLQLMQADLNLEAGVSAEALRLFLESTKMNTRDAFRRYLEAPKGFNHLDYLSLKEHYDQTYFDGFTRGLYLIDKQLLEEEDEMKPNFRWPDSNEKVEIILSTIFWLDELDSSPGKAGWKIAFTHCDDHRLKHYIQLLKRTCMIRYFNNPERSLPREMETLVNGFWEWFDANKQRPIKLIFSAACNGMRWDIRGRGQMYRLHIIAESLLDTLVNLKGLPPSLARQNPT